MGGFDCAEVRILPYELSVALPRIALLSDSIFDRVIDHAQLKYGRFHPTNPLLAFRNREIFRLPVLLASERLLGFTLCGEKTKPRSDTSDNMISEALKPAFWVSVKYLISISAAVANQDPTPHPSLTQSQYPAFKSVERDGVDVFYREATAENLAVVLLLPSFPTSSFQHRHLIHPPRTRNIVSLLSFGLTVVHQCGTYSYTFHVLADCVTPPAFKSVFCFNPKLALLMTFFLQDCPSTS
jgi:hypothetical protein